jgi:hypothetical protein
VQRVGGRDGCDEAGRFEHVAGEVELIRLYLAIGMHSGGEAVGCVVRVSGDTLLTVVAREQVALA